MTENGRERFADERGDFHDKYSYEANTSNLRKTVRRSTKPPLAKQIVWINGLFLPLSPFCLAFRAICFCFLI
ncbi:hypothetical protein D0817_00125 [Flavobacterium cupreum]|uniref:Uncharacterized protein n=1 Tax=Flavobacterium cupreum TaxID=2133766 RepID=A0A434ACH2_9FLAO|nr:hypothetical protein D0817_00125 [Flavobacterium cupreum]